jgi:hypothetical protein
MPLIRRAGVALAALGLVLLLAGASRAEPPLILVVGDSLDVVTMPYLRPALGPLGLEADSRVGRSSSEGLRVLASRLRWYHNVVVFDLGTNDPPSDPARLAGDLAAARKLTGHRCLVVATISRPPLHGASVDGVNRVVREFAARSRFVRLVDWRGFALSHPGLIRADGVHASRDGYRARAALLARGVYGCVDALTAPRSPPPPPTPPPPTPPPPREAKPGASPAEPAARAARRRREAAGRRAAVLDAVRRVSAFVVGVSREL